MNTFRLLLAILMCGNTEIAVLWFTVMLLLGFNWIIIDLFLISGMSAIVFGWLLYITLTPDDENKT